VRADCRAAAFVLLGAFLLTYADDAGRGFIKDDFAWIRASEGSWRVFLRDTGGFYRPLVSLTFAANHALFGLSPRGYGATNLALAIAVAALAALAARRAGLSCGAGLLAAALWAFNPHGVNMAILWISGRTSLLAAAFGVAAAVTAMKDRALLTFGMMLLALLSKEEVLVLPAAWTVCWWWTHTRARYHPMFGPRSVPAAWLAVVAYVALRFRTSAMTPADAPLHYRFTLDPAVVFDNALEYLDRACTWPVVLVLLCAMMVRRRPAVTPSERSAVLFGLLWLAAGYALTIFLPLRSSLYACLPAIGSAIAAAALGGAM
jgi:hypothetical protein